MQYSGPYLEGGRGAVAPQGKSRPKQFLQIFLGKAKYFITILTSPFVARLNCFFITT
jgi:hypothetical protein